MKNLRASIRLLHSKNILFCLVLYLASCHPGGKEDSFEMIERLGVFSQEVKSILNEKESTYEDVLKSMQPFDKVLNRTKAIEDFEFRASYQPHLLLAITNSDSVDLSEAVSRPVIKKIKNYHGLHYIKFSLENKKFKSELLRFNLKSQQEYSDRIMYYSFSAVKDAYLIENNSDTIKGAFVHFERTFDVSPKLNMTFVFERKNEKPLEKLNFVFEDVIFNNGKLNFEFDYKPISVLNYTEINKILL